MAVEAAESAVMSGKPPGEHGIQGLADGFVPELVRLEEVDEGFFAASQIHKGQEARRELATDGLHQSGICVEHRLVDVGEVHMHALRRAWGQAALCDERGAGWVVVQGWGGWSAHRAWPRPGRCHSRSP